MLTFSSLSKVTLLQSQIEQLARFIAEADTGAFFMQTTTGNKRALQDTSHTAARDAVIKDALRQVHTLLDDAVAAGVNVDPERKAWAQKHAQLLPASSAG